LKRIERIYQQLLQIWQSASRNTLLQEQGTTTAKLADLMNLARPNVSADLNRLVRSEKVLKVKSFPIKYLPSQVVISVLKLEKLNYFEVDSLTELVNRQQNFTPLIKSPAVAVQRKKSIDRNDWLSGEFAKSCFTS
jgi:transcriptional regulator with AAA-type ATPase domain